MSFSDLGLAPELLRAVAEKSYTQATPIQIQAIPAVLAGRDVLGGAQTGTGKTAAFVLPILQRLAGLSAAAPATAAVAAHRPAAGAAAFNTAAAPVPVPAAAPAPRSTVPQGARRAPRALVLTPTRELAAQIAESARQYGKYAGLRVQVVFGGVGINPQIDGLRSGCDLLVATPGRLLDLAQQGAVNLREVQTFVLDEADRMLDMGFIRDIRRVLRLLPEARQNLMFSATYSEDIRALANGLLRNPVAVEVATRNATAERVEQQVYKVPKDHKRHLLAHLITAGNWQQVLVFTRTKHGANRLTQQLQGCGIRAAAIHGNKSQGARVRALEDFKESRITALVATEVAARGLDIKELPYVVNYELPNVPEDYVHRIGRTARAGSTGQAVSLVSPDETPLLKDVERLLRRSLSVTPLPQFEISATPPASGGGERRDEGAGRGHAARAAQDVRRHGAQGHGRRPGAGQDRGQHPHPGRRHSGGGGGRGQPRTGSPGGQSAEGAAGTADSGFRRQRMH